MAFKIGDTVALKSGGPRMTVAGAAEDGVTCTWFDAKNELQTAKFPEGALEIDVPEEPLSPFI